jgi:TPR repeat protein
VCSGLRWLCRFGAILATLFPNPLAAQEEHGGEPLLYEHIHTSYRFEADGTGRIVRDHQALVRSQAGAHQLGQILHPYVSGHSRVEVEVLEVTHPDGSVTPAPPSSTRDLPAPMTAAFPVYSDIRIVHLTAPALGPGDRLHYRLVEHVEKPEAPGHFWVEHRFEPVAVVLDEQVEIDLPASAHARVAGPAAAEAELEVRAGRVVRVWKRSHQAGETAANPEPATPGIPPADIQVSSFDSWDAVAAWYRDLQGDRASPTPKLREKAQELVAGAESPRARIEAIYRYVSSEYRYLGLALGAYRYQPHTAAEVMEAGYGDCKDKHTLLAALLEAAGVHAEPVLVGSLRSELTSDLPSPGEFDHIITRVPLEQGEALWIDSTSQVARFGFLPPAVRGKKGLRIGDSDEVSGLIEIPERLPVDGGESIDLEGRIDDDGRLSASVKGTLSGDSEFVTRLMLLNANGAVRQGFVTQLATGLLGRKNAEISGIETDDATAMDAPWSIRFDAEIPELLGLIGAERLVPVGPVLSLPKGEDAASQLVAGSYARRFAVQLPEGVTAVAPGPVAVERDFASYTSSYRVEGASLIAERTLVVRETEIPEERLPEYEALRRTMGADAKQAFEIRSSAPSSLDATADARRIERAASRANDEKQYETAVELYERLLELEPEHATAWYGLGRSLWELKEHARSRDAFERQVQVDPFHEHARNWLGHAHETLNEPEKAEAAYRGQLANLPLDQWANEHLGALLAKSDRCPEAIPFLRKAAPGGESGCDPRVELIRCQLASEQTDAAREGLLGLPASCSATSLNRAANLAEEKLPEVAFQAHLRAAEKGSTWSKADLGWAFEHGRGATRDEEQAVDWYRQAAEEGNADALWRLGRMYEDGRGVPADFAAAAEWYRKAADQGDAHAQVDLGWLYENGRGVEKDALVAAGWYRKAADQGDPVGQMRLAWLYDSGLGVARDDAVALELYQKAAAQGHLQAQVNLGWLYVHGRGAAADPARALEWFQKAAGEDYAAAQEALGWVHDNGRGVANDVSVAADWYRKAAEQGSHRAQYDLGRFYLMGRGVDQDLVESYAWLSVAAVGDAVRSDALDLIEELHGHLSGSDLQRARTRAAELHARFAARQR